MILRLSCSLADRERLLHVETGTLITFSRRASHVAYSPQGNELWGEDARAVIDALDEILRVQDAELDEQVCSLPRGTVELIEGEERVAAGTLDAR